MVTITMTYEGDLRTQATHGPSQTKLVTDAPVDNQGKGASFSPTDLVATALGTCMLTTMGIVAKRHGWALEGASATVEKHMVADPERRIGKLSVHLRLPGHLGEKERTILERTALTCPVHRSLSPKTEIPVSFEWGAAQGETAARR
ncbi:MAG TPA: OsmC family protein [Planctomycetota bacterium]